MIDQKDIDRLFTCRAAIDKFREFKKVRADKIDSGLAVEEIEHERTAAIHEMNGVMAAQGFVHPDGNGSAGLFKEWNDRIVFEIYKECRPGTGKCDLCGETELKDQPCVRKFGINGVCVESNMSAKDS